MVSHGISYSEPTQTFQELHVSEWSLITSTSQNKCKICGINAYKLAINDFHIYKNTLFGIVNLWGRVTEHEYGYRAEYAYPSEIYGSYCFMCETYTPILQSVFVKRCDLELSVFFTYYKYFPCWVFCSENCALKWFDNFFKIRNQKDKTIFKDRSGYEMEVLNSNKVLDMLQSSYGLKIK